MSKVTRSIYVVLVQSPHECSLPLRAFDLEAEANSFVALCQAHDATKPTCPPIEDTPENDQQHEVWWSAYRHWLAGHPGGAEAGYYDAYTVVSLPFNTMEKVAS